MQEKLRVAELRTDASFMKKKREAELQAESLRVKEEICKSWSKSENLRTRKTRGKSVKRSWQLQKSQER